MRPAGNDAVMRILDALGITRRDDARPARPVVPSRAVESEPISSASAMQLAAVYRAVSIISTSMAQLAINVERQGEIADPVPDLIRRPCLHMTRSEFIEQLTLSLALTGNAYIFRHHADGKTIALDPLNPAECAPVLDPKSGVKTVSWRGRKYSSDGIVHLALMRMPGTPAGMGPIQAAARELTGARDVRDYAAKWFSTSGQPAGILTTDQDATAEELRAMRNAWNYLDSEGSPLPAEDNPSRVRALGKGVRYQPILINPKDAQWLETQQFTTVQIARIFGVPGSLMLAAPEGNTQSYSNVEQEWIAFTRFTLTAYVRKIEDALTLCTPLGQTVRFNLESLLRSDTATRYAAHKTAIEIGLYSTEYARKLESIPKSAAPKRIEQP